MLGLCCGDAGGGGSRRRQEIDDLFDGFVGVVVGPLEAAVWAMLLIRPVVKAAIGERSTQAFVEKQQEQGDLNAFSGQAVGVARTVTLD